MNNNILEKIQEGIQSHPEHNAFFIQGQYYTYRELEIKIAGIVNAIQTFTSERNQCIGIIEADNIETYASLLAVLFSGNTYVILNPHNPLERNKSILESTGINLVLASKEERTELNSICKNLIITSNLKNDNSLILDPCETNNESLAYIIFTSGSTGIPKGVPISHKNLNAFYEAYSSLGFQLSSDDRMLQMFDLCFDVSVVSTLYPLSLGACVYTVAQDGVKYTQVYELLEDEELSFATIAPSLLSYLKPYFEEIHLPKLKYLGVTAEASNWDLLSGFLPCCPNAKLVNLYGPTEGTIYCTSYLVDTSRVNTYNGMLAIGNPFKNIDAKIIDDNLNECQVGEKGELIISGDQIMNAYWNQPEKTEEVLLDLAEGHKSVKYYRTGDLCYWGEDECIYYCGRKDYQVQIQGFRVELNEIEHIVRQYHCKGSNVVIANTNTLGNQELHLFLENFEGEELELNSFLENKLPAYMCPKQIHKVGNMPLNTSGKIDRKQLINLIKSHGN